MDYINDKRLKFELELALRDPEMVLSGPGPVVITIKKRNKISGEEKEYNYPLDYQNGDNLNYTIKEEPITRYMSPIISVTIDMTYYDSLYKLLYEYIDSELKGIILHDFDIYIIGLRARVVNLEVCYNNCNNPVSVANIDKNILICADENASKNIVKVLFNDPYTIIFWEDKTKTIVKCQEGDTYDKEKGLAMCIVKKLLGNKYEYYDIFNKWLT